MIEIGRKLNGRYHIIGNIGSGGMANVFLAHDLILDRDVAVKVLRFDFQNDQAAIRRFQREALAATELVHPNIVSVYDVGEEEGLQYLVMEYVKGMDLKRFIQTHYPIPYAKVVDIMQQILSAVALAHEHRIIHRDLKPQNILMDENGVVKITDFGIAIALTETSITQTNTMLGSVHYLSPEQARGSMATNQSDIYAVGVILYEMLTGNVPFDGESAVTIALKHFQEEIPSVKNFDKNCPQSLENIVLHATTKDPADRYKTAEEMSQDLYTVLDVNRLNEPRWIPTGLMGETIALTPINEDMLAADPSKTEEAPEEAAPEEDKGKKKKKSRKPMIIILILLFLALIIGGGLYFAGNSGSSEVKIPDVRDKTEDDARRILKDAGLEVKADAKEIPDSDIDEGRVVKTDPIADSTVKKGREVELYVSSGKKKIKLDDYANEKYKDAVEKLKNLGFPESSILIEKETSLSVEEDTVISQTPEAGEEVDPKTDNITLVVSSGPQAVTIDNYAGYGFDNAVAALVALGFTEGQIIRSDEESDTVEVGAVISQNPAAGSAVNPKTGKITLTVSKGTDKVPLGSYEGMSYTDAESLLVRLGINKNQITKVEEESDTVANGVVISQDKVAGSLFNVKNDKITLRVSKGSNKVSLDDISGYSKKEARDYLASKGLKISEKTEASSSVEKDRVIRTTPGGGETVAVGSTVTVYFSSGPAAGEDGNN